jgi:hypothetical protein
MKALYLLALLPTAAMAQASWDYTTDLTGTQTLTTFNDGPPVDTSSYFSELLYVVVTEGANNSATVAINGATLPQVMNWPLTGAPTVGVTVPIGDSGSYQLSINSSGYSTYDMGVCGDGCDSLQLTGTGTWVDPPAAAVAPELDPRGFAAGFTLLLGLCMISRRAPRG